RDGVKELLRDVAQTSVHRSVETLATVAEGGCTPLPQHRQLGIQLLSFVLEEVGEGGVVDRLELEIEEPALRQIGVQGKETVVKIGIPVVAGGPELLPRCLPIDRAGKQQEIEGALDIAELTIDLPDAIRHGAGAEGQVVGDLGGGLDPDELVQRLPQDAGDLPAEFVEEAGEDASRWGVAVDRRELEADGEDLRLPALLDRQERLKAGWAPVLHLLDGELQRRIAVTERTETLGELLDRLRSRSARSVDGEPAAVGG